MRHKDTGKEQAGSQALQEKLIESRNNRDGKVFVPLFRQRYKLSKERQFLNFWHFTALGYPHETLLNPTRV